MKKNISLIIVFYSLTSSVVFAENNINGKNLYVTNCLMCHGSNGKGDGPVGKNLSIAPFKSLSQENIIKILNSGKVGLMPDFRKSLSLEERRSISEYIVENLTQKK